MHWYFSRLRWDVAADRSVTWIELVLDFRLATWVQVAGTRRDTSKTLRPMARAFAGAARRLGQLHGGCAWPGEAAHHVHLLGHLGLERAAGVTGARPVFLCRAAVEAQLVKIAERYGTGRGDWGQWQPTLTGSAAPLFDPAGAVVRGGLTVGSQAQRGAAQAMHDAARERAREAHNRTAVARGLHVVAPLEPVAAGLMGSARTYALARRRLTCERCGCVSRGQFWLAFCADQCDQQPTARAVLHCLHGARGDGAARAKAGRRGSYAILASRGDFTAGGGQRARKRRRSAPGSGAAAGVNKRRRKGTPSGSGPPR